LSIIIQICGVPTFLGMQSNLLSTNVRCLGSAIWSIFTARRYAKRGIYRRRVSAGFVLTSASRSSSAIADLLVDIKAKPKLQATYAFLFMCKHIVVKSCFIYEL